MSITTSPNPKISIWLIIVVQLIFITSAHSQDGLREEDIQFGDTWLEQIRVSVPDQELLVASIVAQSHDSALASELLSKALESLEHDPILLATAVHNCFSDSPISSCQDNTLFEELVRIDNNNLEPYLYLMLRLIETGDPESALQVLDQGMETTQHNIYFDDKENIVKQKLLSLGYPANEVDYPAGVYANASINYLIFLNTLSTCKNHSVTSSEWKLSCLFLGLRLQNQSRGLMPKVFGGAIQRDVLLAIEADQDVIDLVIEHNEWINKARDLANEKVDWLPTSSDSFAPDTYIGDYNESTEFEAILRAIYRTQ